MARYEIAPDRSQVWIDARSSLHPIHTHTTGLEGFVDIVLRPDGTIDLAVAPTARLSLPVDKLSSGNPLQDRELRRRISARQHPTIDGTLTHLDGTEDPGRYRVTGEISFRGSTQTYEHDMQITAVDRATLHLTGEAIFDVRDFGMEPPRILMMRVEPEVTVRVEVIATSQ